MSLILSTSYGLPVPQGFVLTTNFFDTWFNQLKSYEINSNNAADIYSSLKKHAQQLQFNDVQLRDLREAIKDLNFNENQLYAVRSSSPEEDLEGASFAGGYETVLGVTQNKLLDCIKTCFISCLDKRVYLYKQEHGFNVNEPKIAVVIQKQIESKTSGVAFSINPLNNSYDEAVINANYGLGESVVAGLVTPDTYIVDKYKQQVLIKKLGKKEITITLKTEGFTTETKNESHDFCLSDDKTLEITELVKKVEEYYQKPMDIEWAYENNTLYLLQARPITAYIPLSPAMITKPNEHKRLYVDVLLAKQGINTVFSVAGLDFWSRTQRAFFKSIMGRDVVGIEDGIVFSTDGKSYQDLGRSIKIMGKKAVVKQWRISDALTANALEQVDISEYIPKIIPKNLKGLMWSIVTRNLGTVKTSYRAYKHPKEAIIKYQKIEKDYFKKFKEIEKRYTELTVNELFNKLIEWNINLLSSTLPVTYAIGFAQSSIKKTLTKLNRLSDNALLERSMPNNITIEMGLDLYKLSQYDEIRDTKNADIFVNNLLTNSYSTEFLEKWNNYLTKFGIRCPVEIDLASPRAYENPKELFRQLKTLSLNTDPLTNPLKIYEDSIKKRESTFLSIYNELLTKKGKRAATKFKASYHALVALLGSREIHKYYMIMVANLLRKKLLLVAKDLVSQNRITKAKDIFSLDFNQIDKAVENTTLNLQELIKQNTEFSNKLSNINNFPHVIDSRGKIIRPPAKPLKEGEIQGEPISAGKIVGKVKVLITPNEKPILKGDILVARATDPGWTPLFINAGAIVLEVGGLLQHGALVAREYGKPCVAGVENAVKMLKDDMIIEVDGTTGVIRIIES